MWTEYWSNDAKKFTLVFFYMYIILNVKYIKKENSNLKWLNITELNFWFNTCKFGEHKKLYQKKALQILNF